MPELRYYVAPLLVGRLHGNGPPHRTHPFWRSRLNPDGAPAARVGIMPFGASSVGLLAVTAEVPELEAFGAQAVEVGSGRIGVTGRSRIRAVLGDDLLPPGLSIADGGTDALRSLGKVAQLAQRAHGQFQRELAVADRTRFADLGGRWAALRDEPDARVRLDAALALWGDRDLLIGGVHLGVGPRIRGGALPFTDAFTNTNGMDLSDHNVLWVPTDGVDWTIQSNQAQVPGTDTVRLMYWDETWDDDQYVGLDASLDGNYSQGPAVRLQASGINGQTLQVEFSSGVYLSEYVSGTGTDLDSFVVFPGTPYALELRVEGANYEGLVGSPLVSELAATDSTYTSGKGGISGYWDGNGSVLVRIDNAYGGNIAGAARALTAFRWRNDDGDEDAATWLRAENTN